MTPPDDPHLDAAEFALGLLEGEARAAATRRLLAEPDFAREVARWRAQFETLFAEWPDVAPPPYLEGRVLAALPAGEPDKSVRVIRRWRGIAAAATAVAAAMLVALVLRPAPTPVPVPVVRAAPALVAMLTPTKGKPFAAVYDRAAQEVRLAGGVAVPGGRDAQLWAIGRDGVPRALGLLAAGAKARVAVRNLAIDQGTTLAISIEPAGGSPRPVPTGPVVATGQLTQV